MKRSPIVLARYGFLALGLLSVAGAMAEVPVQVAPRPADQVEQAVLPRAREALAVTEGNLVQLDLVQLHGFPIRLPINIADNSYTLELNPVSLRAAGYHLLVQGADGTLVPTPSNDVRTYRGRLIEAEGSDAAASWIDGGLHAVMILPSGASFVLEPIASRVAGASHRDHMLYPKTAALPTGLGCATPDEAAAGPDADASSGSAATSGPVYLADLAIDADVEYYNYHGSVAATESYVHTIINTVNLQYERDLNIKHLITTIIVRTTEPDPYSADSVGGLINQFRDRWNASYDSIVRDAAQLFTGKVFEGSIGIAFTNSLCFTDAAYSVVRSNACVNFACKTDLSAHELGHVWSANHCNCPGWTMNPTITSANRFHPTEDIPGMISFRNSRTCLSFGDKCDGAGTVDCNENGVTDTCDVAAGTSADVDENGTPDECQPPPGPMLDAENFSRNRTLAVLVPPAATVPPGTLTALRLRAVDLSGFPQYEAGSSCTDPSACVRWLGKPQPVAEYQASPGGDSFLVARLQCTPYYHDWTAEGQVSAVGAEIIPSSVYEIENLSPRCAGEEATCQIVSFAVQFDTGVFGDLADTFDPLAPGTQPDALDVSALVSKFKALPGAPSKAFASLQPNVPDWNSDVNALDIAACVSAFRNEPYPYSGPCPCPSTVACNATPCSTNGACGGGLCVRTCVGGVDEGLPCNNDNHCRGGACGAGFCRDRCGRCNSP